MMSLRQEEAMFVIAGASGKTGRAVADTLRSQGKRCAWSCETSRRSGQ
jgi:hypothetical protein